MAGDAGTVTGVARFLNGDGFGVYEHVRLYVGGDQFAEAQPGGASLQGYSAAQAGPEIREHVRRGCAQIFGLLGAAPAPARRPLPA